MSLEKLFTGSAIAKILDVLWEHQDIDLTITDIAHEAEIHYSQEGVAIIRGTRDGHNDPAGGKCLIML